MKGIVNMKICFDNAEKNDKVSFLEELTREKFQNLGNDVVSNICGIMNDSFQQFKMSNASYAYTLLNESLQYQICNVIYDLLEKNPKNGFLRVFFKDQLNERGITYNKLAQYIANYQMYCSPEDDGEDDGEDDWETGSNENKITKRIASKLQRFTQSNKAHEDSKILSYVCDYFNLSDVALQTGRGKYKYLNYEKLDQIIFEKYGNFKEPRERFAKHILERSFAFKYNDKQIQKKEKYALEYLLGCNRLMAKYTAEEYNIPLEDIYEERDCCFILSADAFEEIYNDLDSSHKSIINRFLYIAYI